MAVQISWYFADKVFLCALTGQVTLDDLKQTDARIAKYLGRGKTPVHVFVDARKLENSPYNLLQLKQIIQAFRDPAIGWEVLIGYQNPIVRFWASRVAQANGIHLQMVNKLEEGVAFLARMDSELAVPGDEWIDVTSNSLFLYSNR